MSEVPRVLRPEIAAVEDPMVLDVMVANVAHQRQALVHGKPMHPVFEEVGIESARDEPES